MKSVGKALATVGAVVLCPCHWPLWLGALAGTSLGAFLAPYATPLLVVAGGGFALAVAYLLKGVIRRKAHTDPPCTSCGDENAGLASVEKRYR